MYYALNGVLVSYLHPKMVIQEKTSKVDRMFGRKLDFKEIKFLSKIISIQKIQEKKKNSISIGIFGYENKKMIQSV